MKNIRSSFAISLATSLVLSAAATVSAQEPSGPSYTFERYVLGDYDTRGGPAVALPDGTIAVPGLDFENETLFVWASADGGETWTQTPFEDEVIRDGMVSYQDRFVAIGRPSSFDGGEPGERSTVWASDDGIVWEDLAALDGIDIRSIAATPDELLLLGLDEFGDTTMFASSDGMAWTSHSISGPLGDEAEGPFPRLYGPVVSQDGVWLVGATYLDGDDQGSVLWRSTDGQQWQATLEPEGAASIQVVSSTPTGFVVTLETSGGIEVHSSADGIAWQQSAKPGGFERWVEAYATDSAGPLVFEAPMVPGPPADFPVAAQMYRLSASGTWEMSPLAIESAWVGSANVAPDGRLFLAGSDLSDCEASSCVFEPGGDRAAIWIGVPR